MHALVTLALAMLLPVSAAMALDLGSFNDARYRCGPAPIYPEQHRRNAVTGEAWVLVRIDKQGKGHDPRVVSSSGHRALDRSAVDAVKQWDFCPRFEGWQKVEAMAVFPIRFGVGIESGARACSAFPSCLFMVPTAKPVD